MSRSTTRTATTTRQHLTKEEKAIRFDVEETIKGKALSGRPPAKLTKEQKKIYKWLFDNLEPSQLLSELDIESMANASIIIDRLNQVDAEINKEGNLLDKTLLDLRRTYFTQYIAICKELCLSPAARSKMGSLALKKHKEETDPLLAALKGGSND